MREKVKIGLTGLPGSGKTSTLLKLVEMLEAEGNTVGGMVTEPIIEDGRRRGLRVYNKMTGESGVLAHVTIESRYSYEKFGVDLTVLETIGVKALTDAEERADIIIIDEVGKLEVESELFVEEVKNVLDLDKAVILTLHKKSRNPLLQDIRKRDDVRILEVTPINRNLLPYKVMKLMKGQLW
ncbi:MAG: NTPase [Candidatus Thermoplasmatota archaeon]|nr:NTPase [Candidatus Thermoplasmatota archaeon]